MSGVKPTSYRFTKGEVETLVYELIDVLREKMDHRIKLMTHGDE